FAIRGACAVATRRIRLGTSISSVFVRSAPTIAMAAATVDQLSGGRFVLGLGSSHRVQVEPEHGIPFVQPTARLRDTIAIARALVRDGAISHRGEVVAIERFDLWFPPRRPHIPIYVAALFPRLPELAGELADGALLTWPTPGAIARAVEHVAIGARRARREPAAVEVTSLIPCAVAETVAAARDAMRPAVAFYAGFFPRYNRLLGEAGFPDAVRAIKDAFDRDGRDAAAPLRPHAPRRPGAPRGPLRGAPARLRGRGPGSPHREPGRVGLGRQGRSAGRDPGLRALTGGRHRPVTR